VLTAHACIQAGISREIFVKWQKTQVDHAVLCLQIRPKEDDSIAVSEIAIADKQSSSLSDLSQATDCCQSLPCEEKPLNIEQPQFTQAIDSSLTELMPELNSQARETLTFETDSDNSDQPFLTSVKHIMKDRHNPSCPHIQKLILVSTPGLSTVSGTHDIL
jgi:hypothetical protein